MQRSTQAKKSRNPSEMLASISIQSVRLHALGDYSAATFVRR
jgi:hypothetical protein